MKKKTILDLLNSKSGIYRDWVKEDIEHIKSIQNEIEYFAKRLKIRLKEGYYKMAKQIEKIIEMYETDRNKEMEALINDQR